MGMNNNQQRSKLLARHAHTGGAAPNTLVSTAVGSPVPSWELACQEVALQVQPSTVKPALP